MQCRCEELAARLGGLERAHRRLRRQAAVLLMGGLGVAALGARPAGVASTVEATKFVLRDASGKVRATWQADQLGYGGIHGDRGRTSITSLTFFDRSGQANAILDASWEWTADDSAAFSSLWLRGRDSSREVMKGLTLGPTHIMMDSDDALMTLRLDGDPPFNAPHLELRRQIVRDNVRSSADGVHLGIRGLVVFDRDGRPTEPAR